MRCLLALALAFTSCGEDPARRQARPNVLLISIDSLRADHLGCYGYERDTSPVLDSLAAEGVRFATALSPTSWTLPAHATLFTGLPPEGHGLRFDARALTPEAHCLAEVFQDAGYATAAFVGGPFLRKMYGFDQGFDVYDDQTVVRSFRESQTGATSPALVGLTSDWLDGRQASEDDAPFFVFLHLWDVHFDYTPPAPYDTLFDPDYDGDISAVDFELGQHIHRNMDPADLAHIVALYDGEIRYTDEWVGRLLEHLKALGQLDDTIVVVTSDHGEEFFEHGVKGHRKNLYDESLLVPLLIRYPSLVPAGRVVREQVRLMDVPVTLAALAGVPLPLGFGARGGPAFTLPADLSTLIVPPAGAGGTPADSESSSGQARRVAFGDLHGIWSSVRVNGSKLLQRTGQRSRELLFDLDSDPREQADITGDSSDREELLSLLAEWKTFWGRRRPPSKEIELSDEQIETLRALGYIR
jgi:arylsulfatase A-like enzyme